MKQTSTPGLAGQAGPGSQRGVIPLYHRVYLLLLQSISDRSFPPDQPMPAETELSLQLGVSRITLRAALDRLEREGLVRRQRGRGTFPLPAELDQSAALPAGLRNQVSLALKTTVRVLDHAIVSAGAAVAGALRIEPGQDVLRILRIRSDTASPISHSVCHVPKSLAHLLPRRQVRALPISAMLESSGVPLDQFSERISAGLADPDVAALLKVEVGSPLLSVVRTVMARDGRVVEHLSVLYRPDRYEYRVDYSGSDANDPSAVWRARVADRTS